MTDRTLGLLLALTAASGVAAARQDPVAQFRLTITQDGGDYVLTLPASQLVMRLPKGDWVRASNNIGGGTANPGYFYFENKTAKQIFAASGWFEPAGGFKGVDAMWADELASFKRNGQPMPAKVSFEEIGSWKAILYSVEMSGMTSAHIRAHWLQAGTWIDLHLSLTSFDSAPDSWRKLRDVLKAIQVLEKKD